MSASIGLMAARRGAPLARAARVVGEGAVAADEDGLARLVLPRGVEVRAVVEMMSGAIWVRDTLAAAGWQVQIAHARKVRDVAPLACKPTRSTRASWPSSVAATWWRSCGSRRSATASCANACAAGRISCACVRRR